MKHRFLIVGLMLLFGLSSVWAQTEPPEADSAVVDSTELFPAAVSDVQVVTLSS